MKKFLIFSVFAACVFGMNAQLTVLKSGNVRIGSSNQYVSMNQPKLDSLATLNLVRGINGTGAYMTFGNLKNVAVGEYSTSSLDSDVLALYGFKGIKYIAGNAEIFYYSWPNNTLSGTTLPALAQFTFNCSVKAPSFLTTSDARMKSDIKGISGLSSLLTEVSPVSYRLATTTEAVKASATNEQQACPPSPDDRVRYGFVAQEVKDVFPELVVEDAEGYLSIDYLGFIPILVDAYKSLEARVKEQEEVIYQLSNNNVRKSPTTGLDGILADGKAALLQNRPNPFRESTMIECVVPNGSAEAFVCVYDLQGTQVKRLNIEERGNCTITIDGSTLKPGMYIYALIIDGAEIDTKKMILTD
ncbi:MAG: T9SS type A sorting domain-containing protein [Bacteroides sp.]|nr:T9SS type A sorting domain-containing protein [Bacteroides sp.]MBD5358641.1 T9SS type A sorting domain-containing protein [Bacteroides sp.]